MRITIVQGAFLPVPPLMGGAVEKVWFGLGKEFARRGHQVTHISRCYGDLPQDEMLEGVRHLRISGFETPPSLALLKLLDLVYSLRVIRVLPEADILVTNTFWLPILVHNHKYGLLYVHVARYPKGQMRFYRHAARLQTVSNTIASAIMHEAPQSNLKVHVIPNPLPDAIDDLDNIQMLTERKKWILYVGRVHPEKGIELLLNAFKQLINFGIEDWRLVIVGPWETRFGGGGEAYYKDLRKQSQVIDTHIEWVGSVFEPLKLQTYYRRAGLFTYPSLAERGETFGLAALEAMAHGCPTLVSDLKCFKDYIEDGVTGFIFNHKSKKTVITLANKLKELVNSQDQLMRVSCNGYNKAQNYTLRHIANLYLSDFESLTQP